MSARRIRNERPSDVFREVGRGMVATSAVLTLMGAGAGLAVATPGHGGDGHGGGHGSDSSHSSASPGHGSGHGDRHGSGHDGSNASSCGTAQDDSAAGVYDDLGLGDPEWGSQVSCDNGSSVPSSAPVDSGGTQQAASSNPASSNPASSNPDDVPPVPGETKVIDIPDRPGS